MNQKNPAPAPFGPPPYLTHADPAHSKYRPPDRLLSDPDAIVIGSGIGGMTVAAMLAKKKKWRILLLEGQPTPGGCTHVHEIDGFEFPSGIDSIGDMDPSTGRGLNASTSDYITDGQLKWAKMPDDHEVAHYEAVDEYRWYSSPEKNKAWLAEAFPDEVEAVNKYYALEEQIEASAWGWALTKLLPTWLPLGFREWVYRLTGGAWRAYMLRTTNSVLIGELGMSKKLAAVFSYMYGNHGRTPEYSPFSFHAVNLFHYRYGAYYPTGGAGHIAECIVPVIERAGGQLAVSSRVKEILIEDNTAVGVELDDGQQVRAPLVISDASAYTTFMDLIDREVSEKHGYPERFKRIGPSVAHLYLLLGYDEWIDLPRQIFWEVPGWDIDPTDRRYKEQMDLSALGAYVLCPSVRDPTHKQRYPDKSTVVVLAEAPYAWVEKCRENPDFEAKFSADLIETIMPIVHRVLPMLSDKKPALQKAGVPMGCNPWAWHSCSLGLDPSAERFTSETHWLRPQTEIKNLWLTGQDPFSAGFSGAMLGGRLCYSAITGDWLAMLRNKL